MSNNKKQKSIEIAKELENNNITKKICIKCNVEYDLKDYRAGENVCKTCRTKMTNAWREENPEQAKDISKRYREKEDKKILMNKYKRETYQTNQVDKISRNKRSQLREFINKDITKEREDFLKDIFGCDKKKFRSWIEYCFKSEMKWNNYDEVWNFDHVKPCSSFDLTNDLELKKCFNWKNTVPTLCSDNYVKSTKIDDDKIKQQNLKAQNFEKEYDKNN